MSMKKDPKLVSNHASYRDKFFEIVERINQTLNESKSDS